MKIISIRIMHIPTFRLIDRIKTKTVLAGVRYFGGIGFRMVKQKIRGSKNMQITFSDDIGADKKTIVDKFHLLYDANNKQTFDNTYWMGIPTIKCPLDLWIFQELIYRTRPDIIIETGTNEGGTSLFLANICDLLDDGQIITVDIASTKNLPKHERIHYLQGDATSDDTINKIKRLMDSLSNKRDRSVMVILDDNHSGMHVLKEMEIYGKLVPVGNYLIVEDTAMGGHPTCPELKFGPYEAVQNYLQTHSDFEIDLSCEKFLMTFNPNGYLKKIST